MTMDAEPTLPEMVDRVDRKLDSVIEAVERDALSRDRQTAMFAKKLRKARIAIRVALVALAAVFLLGAMKWRDDRHQQDLRDSAAVISCRNSNESRAAIEARFEQLLQQTVTFSGSQDPAARAARQEAVDRFVAEFRQSMPVALQPRDCSERAATQPTLVGTTVPG